MNQTDLINTFVPTLLSPGAKQKIAALDSSISSLDYLALSTQALRFWQPSVSTSVTPDSCLGDQGDILQGDFRKQFRDFIKDLKGENADYLAEQIAHTLQSKGLSPHPFDYEVIANFILNHLEWLGTEAQKWAAFINCHEDAAPVHDWLSLDEASWQQGSSSQRERFLRTIRGTDPDRARDLLMADWANCNAELRGRLLMVLWEGLNSSDESFLASLEKDRSSRVKDLATAMLLRLNKGEGAQAMQNLRERLKESSEGIFKKRRCFTMEYPVTLRASQRPSWIFEQFWQLGLSTIATNLQSSTTEMIEGASKDEGLLLCLMIAAINDKDFPAIRLLVKVWPAAWSNLVSAGLNDYPGYTDLERLELIESLVDLRNWPAEMEKRLAQQVLKLWGNRPLPLSYFDTLLKSSWARSSSNFELLALLCPADRRNSIRERMDQNDESQSQACAYLDIMKFLEDYNHE